MVYPISKLIIPPIYRLWIRKIEGVSNIPNDKAFIVAVNHSSYFDDFLLPIIIVPKINKKMHAWVNAYYWKNPFSKFFLDLWGGIPMYVAKEENAQEKNKDSINLTITYLKGKEPVMIFPEGTRNDGKLKEGFTGIARLALAAKVPVLPCGLIETGKVWPKGRMLPGFARCEVRIGNLMQFNQKPNKKSYEEVTRKIMKEIARLINQKYNY